MANALFLNGVYGNVLDEIIKFQEGNPGKVFYLQPYSESSITKLKKEPSDPNAPLPLYISTTGQLNQICYTADIIGWEDKSELLKNKQRLAFLNEHIKLFQPAEIEIYFEVKERKCTNLIFIRNLKKLTNLLSTTNLIKESDGKPLKARTRSGGWSYVYALPLLSIDKVVIKERLAEELEKSVSESLKDDDDLIRMRLANAPIIPEKVQTISYDFRRNPDVIAAVLKRAQGKCELCSSDAPFFKASDGSPYLEVHHWITLSEGGEDTVDNAGALCPNCHKNSHFGQIGDYIKSYKAAPSLPPLLRLPTVKTADPPTC